MKKTELHFYRVFSRVGSHSKEMYSTLAYDYEIVDNHIVFYNKDGEEYGTWPKADSCIVDKVW